MGRFEILSPTWVGEIGPASNTGLEALLVEVVRGIIVVIVLLLVVAEEELVLVIFAILGRGREAEDTEKSSELLQLSPPIPSPVSLPPRSVEQLSWPGCLGWSELGEPPRLTATARPPIRVGEGLGSAKFKFGGVKPVCARGSARELSTLISLLVVEARVAAGVLAAVVMVLLLSFESSRSRARSEFQLYTRGRR